MGDLNNLVDEQNDWVKNHINNYDIYQLAKDNNEFALFALAQNIIDNPFRSEKNNEIINNTKNVMITLAKDGNIHSFSLLKKAMRPFVYDCTLAYCYGLLKNSMLGWVGSINFIDRLLTEARRENNDFATLNELAKAGINGFFTGDESSYPTEQQDIDFILSVIKDPVLVQNFNAKLQELHLSNKEDCATEQPEKISKRP